MPRGTTYANNASNRSLGRAGMAMGSAPVSRSSGGSSSGGYGSSGSSGSSSKTYVDNSYNRSLGRVGMDHGSMVASRSSSSSSSTPKTYVDNASNRNLGRVGMEHGTMSVSSSSTSSTPTPKTYVDNAYNRSLGRVGLKHGTMSVSRSSASSDSKPGTYVDNPFNRSQGRVGMDYGTKVVSSKSSSSSKDQLKNPEVKLYKDNAANRRLGRAGKPLGSMPVSSKKTKSTDYLQKAHEHMMNNPYEEFEAPFEADGNLESHFIEQLNRMELSRSRTSTRKPFEWYEGSIIKFGDLTLGKKIGHGGFGDVHHGHMKGKEVAIKKLRVQRVSQKRLTQFEDEVRIFCKLKHKNIITFYGACIETPNLCIVMELMNGSLYDELHVKDYQFSDTEKTFIAMEVADGLKYLHSKNVAHCDIKPTNVLINIATEGADKHEVKITDFGLSKIKNYSETSHSKAVGDDMVRELGTPRYSAPEVLRGEFLDTNGMMMTDVYSFGLVIFEIFSGDEVFDDYNAHQLRKNVGNGDHKPSLHNLLLSGKLQDLMRKCWERTPTTRPTAGECFDSLKKIYQTNV
ncbi:kinase suppressor of Ras 2-like [Antedon mediterranea]|uniref:kinase suppressor of Ras 2-like n=1 Tax=Antedon mediterranea TaxID=105859 RepID=UPI003AF782AF